MTDRKIRFAVVGYGLMGKRHAQLISRMPAAELAAVCDRDDSLARQAAAEFPGVEPLSFDDVLANPQITAVVLCLPSSLHASFGIKSAHAGKHVIIEKPIATNTEEAHSLAEACRLSGVLCAVISQNRFADGFASLKQALENGLLGTPALIEANVKWFRHDEYYQQSDWRGRIAGEGGGVIMNQAIHTIDLLLWLFGMPEKIQPLIAQHRPGVMETEDTAVAAIQFPQNVLCSFSATTSAFPGHSEQIAIYGQKASCVVTSGAITHWSHESNVPLPVPDFEPSSPDLPPKLVLFERQYRNIMGAISGTQPLLVTPQQSIDTLAVARAFYRA